MGGGPDTGERFQGQLGGSEVLVTAVEFRGERKAGGTVVREGLENERDGGIVFVVGVCAFALGGVLCEEGVTGL